MEPEAGRNVLVLLNEPLLGMISPKYLYSFTTSNSVLLDINLWFLCRLPVLNIRTSGFEKLTVQ